MATRLISTTGPEERAALAHNSSRIEKLVEYGFVREVAVELYRRGPDFAVLRDDVDADGRDILLEARGILRHVQLKAMVAGGARANITVNSRLALRRSACVIWIIYDPQTFLPVSWLWFGGAPGEIMPSLGDRVARSTRRNIEGVRTNRDGHRILARNRFEPIATIATLVDRLFGCESDSADRLDVHLADHAGLTARDVCAGMSADLTFDSSGNLAGLIDGYVLGGFARVEHAADWLEQQTAAARRNGRWPGDAADLWTALFLEHRRSRFTETSDPDSLTAHLRDLLCRQLVEALYAHESCIK